MSHTVPKSAKDGDGHDEPRRSVCIDWYAEGQTRTVEVAGVRVTVRFIGRRGRRGRIAIEAPAGAIFTAIESRVTARSAKNFT
jgi:hypothetical protein